MQRRPKSMQKRSFARQVSFEPWKLNPEFPLHVVDYTHRPREMGPFHIHDVLEIGWCRSGSGVFMVEDKAYSFRPGDIYIISSLEAHYAYPPSGVTSEWTFVFFDPLRLVGSAANAGLLDLSGCWGAQFDNHFHVDANPGLSGSIISLVREYQGRGPYFQDAIRGHIIQILVELNRRSRAATPSSRAMTSESALRSKRSSELMGSLEPALNIIARDYARPLPLKRLSHACFMSASHFRRVFTSQLGVSPRDYLLGYRIAMAACLLTGTTTPITRIALDTGFQTLSSFNRQFLQRKGCSPRDWRNGRGKAPV